MQYIPPFTVSAKSISLIAEISAAMENFSAMLKKSKSLKLRRANKIKTIHSSLAIEGNNMTQAQVSDILDGKRVAAAASEILEVKNAIATYDLAHKLNPFSERDLLRAHKKMMSGLVKGAGRFRNGGVGVFSGRSVIHIAPPAEQVPALVSRLFDWLKTSQDHLLVRSCVFHYEFEFIHPFADGNGRMGRLWQSLILSKLNPAFMNLPVETMVYKRQKKYYEAINSSTKQADCAPFIEFMLGEILNSVKAAAGENFGAANGAVFGAVNGVLSYVSKNGGKRANAIAEALGVPLRTVQRRLKTLKDAGKIKFEGAAKTGGYFAVKKRGG